VLKTILTNAHLEIVDVSEKKLFDISFIDGTHVI